MSLYIGYITTLLKHLFSVYMIRLWKVFSPLRHILYYDWLSPSSALCPVSSFLSFLCVSHQFISKFSLIYLNLLSSCYVQMYQCICLSYLPRDVLPESSWSVLLGQDFLCTWCIWDTFFIRSSLYHPSKLEPISWILSLLSSCYFPFCL